MSLDHALKQLYAAAAAQNLSVTVTIKLIGTPPLQEAQPVVAPEPLQEQQAVKPVVAPEPLQEPQAAKPVVASEPLRRLQRAPKPAEFATAFNLANGQEVTLNWIMLSRKAGGVTIPVTIKTINGEWMFTTTEWGNYSSINLLDVGINRLYREANHMAAKKVAADFRYVMEHMRYNGQSLSNIFNWK